MHDADVTSLANLLPPSEGEVGHMLEQMSTHLRRALLTHGDLRAAWTASNRAMMSLPARVGLPQSLLSAAARAGVIDNHYAAQRAGGGAASASASVLFGRGAPGRPTHMDMDDEEEDGGGYVDVYTGQRGRGTGSGTGTGVSGARLAGGPVGMVPLSLHGLDAYVESPDLPVPVPPKNRNGGVDGTGTCESALDEEGEGDDVEGDGEGLVITLGEGRLAMELAAANQQLRSEVRTLRRLLAASRAASASASGSGSGYPAPPLSTIPPQGGSGACSGASGLGDDLS